MNLERPNKTPLHSTQHNTTATTSTAQLGNLATAVVGYLPPPFLIYPHPFPSCDALTHPYLSLGPNMKRWIGLVSVSLIFISYAYALNIVLVLYKWFYYLLWSFNTASFSTFSVDKKVNRYVLIFILYLCNLQSIPFLKVVTIPV